MRSTRFVILAAALSGACTTIQVPLPGTNIMRPRAGLADVGARISTGLATTPAIEGAIDPVLDSQGRVINPLPGEEDVNGDKVPANSGVFQVELAVDWSKKYEVGLSTNRGLFAMWDYAVWKNAALTLTPSYSTNDSEGGDPELSTEVDENGEEVLVVDHAFEGHSTNLNLTQLGSVWIGSPEWAAIYLYGGVGINSFTASIKQKSTDVEEKTTGVAPSVLAGIHLRLLIFELTVEQGATQVKYRDGESKTVPTVGMSFAMHIAI